MNELIQIYNGGVEKNLENIKGILGNLDLEDENTVDIYRNILSQSSDEISSKWDSGKKYVRTYYVREAFGDKYPENHLEMSLAIDAMVNILDDMYDEDLGKEQKAVYVIEFLRSFSLYNKSNPSKEIQDRVANYFNELITLAVAEGFYKEKIEKETDLDQIVKYSVELLLTRAMDMDIFNEIAISEYENKDIANEIRKAGNIFRALNIFKKDIDDVEHDKANGMESIVTNILDREDVDFSEYTNKLKEYLLNELRKLNESNDDMVLNNFLEMSENVDIKDIK